MRKSMRVQPCSLLRNARFCQMSGTNATMRSTISQRKFTLANSGSRCRAVRLVFSPIRFLTVDALLELLAVAPQLVARCVATAQHSSLPSNAPIGKRSRCFASSAFRCSIAEASVLAFSTWCDLSQRMLARLRRVACDDACDLQDDFAHPRLAVR